MRACVVDASVLVAALTNKKAKGAWALQVILEYEIFGPELALVEATNVIRRMHASEQLDPSRSEKSRLDLLAFPITLLPFEPVAERVWELRDNVTCYDAFYIALAEALATPLATLDQRLTQASGPKCRFLQP